VYSSRVSSNRVRAAMNATLAISVGLTPTGLLGCGESGAAAVPASDAGPGNGGPADGGAAPGDPIPTVAGKWVWAAFPEARCRDGSSAGIEVNANPGSEGLLVYLEGGGSCWNTFECGGNPATFTPPSGPPSSEPNFFGATGIFDRDNPDNPVGNWNMVYVPYCTGDLHAGNNPGFDPGPGPQQFVGYTNMEKFLERLVPTFPEVTKILHTGVSAGGFGALMTVELVKERFPESVDVVFLDDSGPMISTAFVPACLQRKKRTTWGFDRTFLAGCGADCPDPDEYLVDYARHLARAPTLRGGILEAIADATLIAKGGYTESACDADATVAPPPMDPARFEEGLLDFRARIASVAADGGTANFGTFYVPGVQHVWLSNVSGNLYTAEAGGVKVIDWIRTLLDGGPPSHVGP